MEPEVKNKNSDGLAIKSFRNLSAAAVNKDRSNARNYFANRSKPQDNLKSSSIQGQNLIDIPKNNEQANLKGSDPKESQAQIAQGAKPQSDKIDKDLSVAKQSGVSEGAAATAQATKKVTDALTNGGSAGESEAGVGMAATAGGAWLVDFLWYSTLEIFPGAIYGLPALTLYMLIGIFTQDSAWHQLAKWQMIVIILCDLLLIFLILLLIVTIVYAYCTGFVGAATKTATAVGAAPDFCSAFKL